MLANGFVGVLLVGMTLFFVPIPVWIVSQFQSEIRYSAVAISYNFAQALFGGTTPLMATALLDASQVGCTTNSEVCWRWLR